MDIFTSYADTALSRDFKKAARLALEFHRRRFNAVEQLKEQKKGGRRVRMESCWWSSHILFNNKRNLLPNHFVLEQSLLKIVKLPSPWMWTRPS